MTINYMLAMWIVDKVVNWQNVKLTKWYADNMLSWQNDKLIKYETKWQVDKIISQ